jgi:hypothetical protein
MTNLGGSRPCPIFARGVVLSDRGRAVTVDGVFFDTLGACFELRWSQEFHILLTQVSDFQETLREKMEQFPRQLETFHKSLNRNEGFLKSSSWRRADGLVQARTGGGDEV